MASTEITFTNEGGAFVPDIGAVPVVSGDTVSFATSDGSPVVLHISPAAVAILSPTPSVPFVLAASTKAEFTFTSSAPGAYTLFASGDDAPEPSYPEQVGTDLHLEVRPPVLAMPTFPIVGSRTKDGQG